jgi:hypothetical protein
MRSVTRIRAFSNSDTGKRILAGFLEAPAFNWTFFKSMYSALESKKLSYRGVISIAHSQLLEQQNVSI